MLNQLLSISGCVGASYDGEAYRVDFSDGSSRLATADELLTASKAAKIAAINDACRFRLINRFGSAEEQVSRSLGIYGATEKFAMESGIAATIDASNVASNAVLAAASIAEVEAVTVTWPVI